MPILDDAGLKLLFFDARSFTAWRDEPVLEPTLRQLYALVRMAPTGANSQPIRIVFVQSSEAKERLKPALSPGNVDKTMAAPVTAILAHDLEFYEQLPKLMPEGGFRDRIASLPKDRIESLARQSATLQGGYLILAARALGLDCGPMGGFNPALVDAEFFPDGKWKANLLVNIGHGDPATLRPRSPRLEFEEACRIV